MKSFVLGVMLFCSLARWFGVKRRSIRSSRVRSCGVRLNVEQFDSRAGLTGGLEYIKKLKSAGKSFSHFNKKSDYERGLEAAGYKQIKKDKRRLATFVGYEGNECPQFRTISEPQVSFCAQYLPDYKEQEQYQLLLLFGRQNPTIEPKAFDVFPQTWRLYKIAERRALKVCGVGYIHMTCPSLTTVCSVIDEMWERFVNKRRWSIRNQVYCGRDDWA